MEKMLMKFRPLPLIAVALYAVASLFTGCANPTNIYKPTELPERTKGEYVQYKGADIKTKGTQVAFESKTADSMTVFQTTGFCYDPKNDYIVFPTSRSGEGYYMIIPTDSVTLCKNGEVWNNSYFSRNHLLRGIVIGGILGGGIGAFAGFPMAAIFSLMGDGSNFGLLLGLFAGSVATIGAATGAIVDPAIHQSFVDDIKFGCPSYYTEEELQEYLNKNLCY